MTAEAGGIRGRKLVLDFRDDACCGNPSVETRIQEGLFAAPPGYR